MYSPPPPPVIRAVAEHLQGQCPVFLHQLMHTASSMMNEFCFSRNMVELQSIHQRMPKIRDPFPQHSNMGTMGSALLGCHILILSITSLHRGCKELSGPYWASLNLPACSSSPSSMPSAGWTGPCPGCNAHTHAGETESTYPLSPAWRAAASLRLASSVLSLVADPPNCATATTCSHMACLSA